MSKRAEDLDFQGADGLLALLRVGEERREFG